MRVWWEKWRGPLMWGFAAFVAWLMVALLVAGYVSLLGNVKVWG